MADEQAEAFILEVPPQPRFNVGPQLSYCCRRCGLHFITRAGMGRLVPVGRVVPCELHYAGCLDPPPEATS